MVCTKHCSKAFTLAEVLISLAIIGVVAALTISTVIRNYQKEQTVVRLKKAYSQINQAITLAEIEHGNLDGWDYSLQPENFYNTYLKPHLKVIKYYGYISTASMGVTYKALNGADASNYYFTRSDTIKFILGDGILVSVDYNVNPTDKYKGIYVDVNGFKKPNVYGKDLFVFSIQPKYRFMPWGLGEAQESFGNKLDRAKIMDTSYSRNCNKTKSGVFCAALIMLDGWQIRDDYPW